MIKMVASDLDGTLLVNGRQSIPGDFSFNKKIERHGDPFCGS